MALRSGSGGLKYPLTNWAQLQAQQSAAAASSGGSASASAYGANRQYASNKMRVQADLLNSERDRQLKAYEGFQDRSYRAQSQLEGQRFDAERQEAIFGQQQTLQQQGQEFTTQRDAALFEQDQAAIDADIEAQIRKGELELSPKAQQQIRELEDGKSAAKEMDPAQQADYEQQQQAKRRQIIRGATKPIGPSADERASKNRTFYDPQTGSFSSTMTPGSMAGTVDDNGKFEPIVDTSAQDKQQREDLKRQQEADQKRQEADRKLKEDIYEAAQKRRQTADGVTPPSFQEAYEAELKERRLAGAPTPEQAPDEPAPVAPPGKDSTAIPARAPEPLPRGMADSVYRRSGGDLPEQAPAAPSEPAAPPIDGDTFNKQWSALQPGQSMVGPDGKTYIKKPGS